jgi:hypothetical protein
MGVTGTLIAESLRVDTQIEGFLLTTTKVTRVALGDVAAGQPHTWTFIEFQVDDGDVDHLVAALEGALSRNGGWYCDLRSDAETFVVFAGRTFRYPRGDGPGRAAAVEYGRSAALASTSVTPLPLRVRIRPRLSGYGSTPATRRCPGPRLRRPHERA